MQVTVELPDDLANKLIPEGQDPAQALLEETALQVFVGHRITRSQLRSILRFETRYELDGFLKRKAIEHDAYTVEDLEQDIRTVDEIHRSR